MTTIDNRTAQPRTALATQTIERVWFLAATALVSVILILRSWMRFLHPQFYAEDGNTFFRDAYNLPFWQSVLLPYRRGLYIATRVLSEIALLFRLELTPFLFVLFSLLVAAACCALFASSIFAHIIPGRVWRLLVVIVLALLPALNEISMLLSNVHWFFGIVAFFLVFVRLPRSLVVYFLYGLLWGLLCMSAPQLLVFVPCLAVRAIFVNEDRLGMALALLAAVPVSLIILLLPSGNQVEIQPNQILQIPFGVVNGITLRVLGAGLFGNANSLAWFYHSNTSYVLYVLFILYVVVNVLVARVWWLGRQYGSLLAQAYVNYCIAAPIALALFGRPELIPLSNSVTTFWSGDRYFVLPLAAFYFGAIWCAWHWWRLRWVKVAALACGAIFLVGTVRDARESSVYSLTDVQWQQQVRRVYAAESAGRGEPVSIAAAPDAVWIFDIMTAPSPLPDLGSITVQAEPGLGVLEEATVWEDNVWHPLLFVRGWADPAGCGSDSCDVLIVDHTSQQVIARTFIGMARGDIADVLHEPRMFASGWSMVISGDTLAPGEHQLQALIYNPASATARLLGERVAVTIPAHR